MQDWQQKQRHWHAKRLAKALGRRKQAEESLLEAGKQQRLDADPDALIEVAKDFHAAQDEIDRLRNEKRP